MRHELKCPHCFSSCFIKSGFSAPTACLNGDVRQRYKCLECSRRFSQNACLMSYRQKKLDRALNAKILQLFLLGTSNRQIARVHSISEECVRRRLDRLAKQALLFHAEKLRALHISEPIAFDGLENFAGSQYDPNNIQQAVGSESLFIYDFNFAPLNRKGRMSSWQKLRLIDIEAEQGRYDPRSIRRQTTTILRRLCARTKNGAPLELWSDEHFQYRRAVDRDLKKCAILHKTVSSRACRNFQNILFSVNHKDLLIRQQVAAFTRETISFAKTAGRMVQKFVLFAVYKNYMSPQFTKKHVRRPKAHEQSPAQSLGLCSKLLSFKDIFASMPSSKRAQELLTEDWRHFYDAQVPDECLRSKKFLRKKAA